MYTLSEYLSENTAPDFILNIWVCGKKEATLSGVLQVCRIKNLANDREDLVPIYTKMYPLVSIANSEKVLTDVADLWEETLVDMESYAISFVASKKKIPYAILKIPFDTISESSKHVSIEALQKTMGVLDMEYVTEKLLQFFEKNPKRASTVDLEKYRDFFRFTHAESEQFRILTNKFIAFWIDFLQFFERHKDVPKEEFLQKMRQQKKT